MKRIEPYKNQAAALLLTILCAVVVSVRFLQMFDLNDDILIGDILSGAYTGTPEGHNIQMLYPLSALLALLYRIVPRIAWYGLFLTLCQYVCLWLLLSRFLLLSAGTRAKVLTGAVFAAVFGAAFLPHAVFYGYTVTCALCAATAGCFLATATRRRDHVTALALLLTAYAIRSEMLLLTLPLCGVAFLFRAADDFFRAGPRREERRAAVKPFVTTVIALTLGVLCITVIHEIAYGSPEWKTFVTLFDRRTELYDFQGVPGYEQHADFYESIGLTQSEQALLENYNYGLDESITEETLGAIVAYAKNDPLHRQNRTERVSSVMPYLYRLRHFVPAQNLAFPLSDAPWNVIVIFCYIMLCLRLARPAELWKLLLLFACRTSLWMYILLRGRDPVRITNGLYLVEICIIAGVILYSAPRDAAAGRDKIAAVLAILLAIVSLGYAPNTYRLIQNEEASRRVTEEAFSAVTETMASHDDLFYYMDVYTWVPVQRRLYAVPEQVPANYDILGGWACKSPLWNEKAAALGAGVQEALTDEAVRFVQNADRDTAWLSAYYAGKGITVTITEETRVGEFVIYRVAQSGR